MASSATALVRSPRLRLVRAAAVLVAGLSAATVLAAAPASADPSPSDWAALRSCESGGSYTIVSRSGTYRGAYQFNLGTWRSVGGAGSPEKATPAEQDYRALTLYRMRGWQPWTCAGMRGLRDDKDAGSGRLPTRAEAAQVGGHATSGSTGDTSTGTADVPAWAGRTLAYGDCAPAVKAFQLQMNQRGYSYHFQGTGCYAAQTRAAVRAVQQANDLTVRDRIDEATWTAAFSGSAPR